MDGKRKLLITAAVILGAILIGAAGFLAGRNEAESRFTAERELNIRLNRSDLDGLGEIEGPIYVTGHKSPDSDAVCSAIAYAALLRELGYDARPVILGDINNETRFILEQSGLEVPMLLEDASGCKMVLVDHSEYSQSAEGLKDANVISIIDHHGDGSVTTGNQMIYDARPIGATATIIWLRYRNYGIRPEPQIARAMAGAILSDTTNFRASGTTFADREAVKDLSRLAGIEDTDALFQELFKASISYDGMSDDEIFLNDYREYEAGSKKYGIGVINAYDDEAAKELALRMKNTLPSLHTPTGMDMLFAQISIFHDDLSITYLVPSGEAAAEVLEAAFGDRAVFDGTSFRLEPGISRKVVLVPAITDVLNAYPSE